ncbi:MAG: LysM peptidoglycan-binding domain-containing protein [Bacteroidales bacterium]|jgi:membrane-bound lytic murein transglycosylase D|nr:LysM peptidoglycan-binding domain-containing protein [Bacteroidales bacterium]MCK9499671.1 LysM peptidoglycan-binding domain-containing protein [Bacteroidales bacterium]MDY0314588.1 LysM peptidoglycan-binding domain-containing protein [Bacteroidales bacterium]
MRNLFFTYFIFHILLVCIGKDSFSQYLSSNEFISDLKTNLSLFKYDNETVLKYCEDINFSKLYGDSEFVNLGNETYALNNISFNFYSDLQNLDYKTKCLLLYALADLRTKTSFLQDYSDSLKNLEYLPFLVSRLNKYYVNSTTAYGFWALQFMPALRYGLCIDTCYDQRLDAKISSRVAGKYLMDLHNSFGSWDYAVMAYVSSPAIMRKAMKNTDSFDEALKKMDINYQNYFYHYLAIVKWFSENEIINPAFYVSESYSLTDTIFIKDRLHFEQISEYLELDLKILKKINPLFTGNIIDGRKSEKEVYLPLGYKDKFYSNIDSILVFKDSVYFPVFIMPNFSNTSNSNYVSISPGKGYEEIKYTIQTGDNLGYIAQKYSVKISDLQDWNNIKGTNIYAGKVLSIWVKEDSKLIVENSKPNSNDNNNTAEPKKFDFKDYELVETITIEKGDSLYKISQNYSWASAEDIMYWNGINDASKLQIGQKLQIYKKK